MKHNNKKSRQWIYASLNHKQYQGNGIVNLEPLPNKIIDKLKKIFNF